APSKRGTEPVEHLGGARLRRVDHQGELLAGLELVGRLDDQRIARQSFLERGENLQRVSVVSLPRRLMSHAWPRLMPCFDGEASEVLMHPLGTAFNVGDNHANHLSSGHALWGA